MPQEETNFPEGSRIVSINPASKYVILLPEETTPARMNELAELLANWWYDENPFLIMTNEIFLIDVTKTDVITDGFMTMETPESDAKKEEN